MACTPLQIATFATVNSQPSPTHSGSPTATAGTAAVTNNVPRGTRGPVHTRVPPGDDKPRLVCDDCGYVAYKNPLVVAGCVVLAPGPRVQVPSGTSSDLSFLSLALDTPYVLLCKRDIEPRRGFWTLPAGYLECGESTSAGAAREASEEACASVKVGSFAALYSVPRISQIHMWYSAALLDPTTNKPADEGAVSRLLLGQQASSVCCSPHQRRFEAPPRLFAAGHETQDAALFPLLLPEDQQRLLAAAGAASGNDGGGRARVIAALTGSGLATGTVPLLPWADLAFPSVELILRAVAAAWKESVRNGFRGQDSGLGHGGDHKQVVPSTVAEFLRPGRIPFEDKVITAMPQWAKEGRQA